MLSALVTLMLQEALLKNASHLSYSMANESQLISLLKESETHIIIDNNEEGILNNISSDCCAETMLEDDNNQLNELVMKP